MTKLLYLEQFDLLETDAVIIKFLRENEREVAILDQTVFYPQGGGQPYDQGRIESSDAVFRVEETRFIDGAVKHIGSFERGSFEIGEMVHCFVDRERRELLSRIHSVGHLVDRAVFDLGLGWIPGKGFHYPDGPYDEYKGSLEGVDREKIRMDIERLCNEYVQRGGKTELLFMDREEMKTKCYYVPDYSDEKESRARIVVHQGFYMPCGGTPVSDLSEIGHVIIRKVKPNGSETIRVGYDVER